ncbi:class I SAM-dependent methyltransferase [Synoicihabitans lomoniglobus]|uniref:Class I SAM-dependent methyltransferase n=1 Tax=Synoicihabitans lomoniglobus TaxID=2909285 RepID=A0AAE9ZWZ9_9BACT|nr:class I SAM-dependent methyltransferase [Opitutaceae bacterium LMO-M01]WED65697.1 class I SAM-dependent methyltransferase [Opitutaceae bacterium LMO-M01]
MELTAKSASWRRLPWVLAVLETLEAQTSIAPARRVQDLELQRMIAYADGDGEQLARAILRRLAGEPLAYIVGELEFGGRFFWADQRAYITDPETIWLVREVVAEIRNFEQIHQRWPVVAEFGVGGGALSISVKLECPEVTIIGLDIDDNALAVGRLNALRHGVAIELLESNLFSAWSDRGAPDLIFGDPPWGGEDDLYDEVRDAAHYHAMPAASAFPVGGVTGAHQQLLQDVYERRWTSRLILNAGVLRDEPLAELTRQSAWHEIRHPAPDLALLVAQMHR